MIALWAYNNTWPWLLHTTTSALDYHHAPVPSCLLRNKQQQAVRPKQLYHSYDITICSIWSKTDTARPWSPSPPSGPAPACLPHHSLQEYHVYSGMSFGFRFNKSFKFFNNNSFLGPETWLPFLGASTQHMLSSTESGSHLQKALFLNPQREPEEPEWERNMFSDPSWKRN